MELLLDKSVGCLVGAAVGDALGGATETALPEQIRARYGGWVEGVVPPFHADWATARPLAPYHKGDGHITDDTLMTHALVRTYLRKRDHLDAFDVAELLVPDLIERVVYLPDLEREGVTFHRLAAAERWLVTRLHHAHVDPREGGVGNIVNCGAAMYMAPVGVVNAGDPAGAYAEAVEIAGAHQHSYGREAAAVFAAAVAAAMAPGAGVGDVVAAALDLARDGTRAAIAAVVKQAEGYADWRDAIGPLRAAVAPYDTVGEDYRNPGLGARRPSRLHAIEELPIALGMLVVAKGNLRQAVLGAVNYGRDADSTATMAGAIAGALGGAAAVPTEWSEAVAEASRTDLVEPARQLAGVAAEIFALDRERFARRAERFARLTTPAGPEGAAGDDGRE
ncbi:ADP-ribosylglycohydrolase family protein [Micromonospora sp. HM5-17]|jgi:ADP-ribosylglycohydrolase|uniref:ADP-ribosylglycohydrolase family protein n=1 Tax=Micromonospora sp. HM5-17 TaxID=2487710 RepID=UPI000F4A19AD|nr:ADP-ribosylglycohydrolase family protein [Micromonospora sp. HM5-17]ROT32481.1 ADP-ribosylglycohydrolase family protein [Micromonospora sp. HM5-17]